MNAIRKFDGIAGAQPLGVADEGLPAAQVDPLVQRRANPGIAAPTFQLGRDHAGVVEDQHIAAPQQAGQIAHGTVGQRALTRHMQQPRRIARLAPDAAQSALAAAQNRTGQRAWKRLSAQFGFVPLSISGVMLIAAGAAGAAGRGLFSDSIEA